MTKPRMVLYKPNISLPYTKTGCHTRQPVFSIRKEIFMTKQQKHENEILETLRVADDIYIQANKPGPKKIYDADCILKDQGMPSVSGLYLEISQIYRETTDKAAFEKLFETLTAMPFQIFLEEAIKKTETQETSKA